MKYTISLKFYSEYNDVLTEEDSYQFFIESNTKNEDVLLAEVSDYLMEEYELFINLDEANWIDISDNFISIQMMENKII